MDPIVHTHIGLTESNLMAGSLMMMSSVPLRWDPVQFQKQIQPFIFQIIVAVYQLLPVFYLSLRLMWSFSQTAYCANGIMEYTCRIVCLYVCVCGLCVACTVSRHFCTTLKDCTRTHGSLRERLRLLVTIMRIVFFFSTLFCCIYLWDHFYCLSDKHLHACALHSYLQSGNAFACRFINPPLLCVICCVRDECVMLYRIINSPWVGVWHEFLSQLCKA